MERTYLEQLRQPAAAARGKTRWWWYGCRVDKDNISYQLDQMQEAGIGGVEIQILYAPGSRKQGKSGIFLPGIF